MKRRNYFYTVLLLGILALVIYGLINYFLIMIGLIAFSSVFNFVLFLIQTRVKPPVANKNYTDNPVDFYTTSKRTTYYQKEQNLEPLKHAN